MSNPPPYSDKPGFIPASNYQGQPGQQPLYPPMPMPMPPGQQYQAPPGTNTVIITTAPSVQVGSEGTRLTCPSCRADIVTTVKHVPNTCTHFWALFLCLTLACWPCICVPYCVDSCQSATHYCPNCQAYIGTYEG